MGKADVINPDIIRISYIDRIRTCNIMYGFEAVGELVHEFSSLSGEEDWIIRPYWEVLDRLGFESSIPGIDEDLRKEEYIRRFKPILVTQRTIPEGRDDLGRWLKRLKMDYYDVFEFMCRSHSVCTDNDLYISRNPYDIIDVFTEDRKFPVSIPDVIDEGWLSEGYINKEDQIY